MAVTPTTEEVDLITLVVSPSERADTYAHVLSVNV